jgi:uncharacterized protein YyaL (SSP411 family)
MFTLAKLLEAEFIFKDTLSHNRKLVGGKSSVYICNQFVCQPAIFDKKKLTKEIERLAHAKTDLKTIGL